MCIWMYYTIEFFIKHYKIPQLSSYYPLPFAFLPWWRLHDRRADLTKRACKPCQLMRSQTCPSGHQITQAQGPFAFAKPTKANKHC